MTNGQEPDLREQTTKAGVSPEEALQRLQDTVIEKFPQRIDDLLEAFRMLGFALQNDTSDVSVEQLSRAIDELKDQLHNLIGTAGTFGYLAVGNIADEMNKTLNTWLWGSQGVDSAPWSKMIYLAQQMADIRNQPPEHSIAIPQRPQIPSTSQLIHVVDDDADQAQLLARWLSDAGYTTEIFTSVSVFYDLYQSLKKPDLILMDMRFDGEQYAGANYLRRLQRNHEDFPAVVFISVMDSLEARLTALRAGASRYLTKPIARDKFLDLVETFSHPESQTPYRILLVDDDEQVLAAMAATLRIKRFDVKEVSQPLTTLDHIKAFKPDVLVLDVYMPDVSGPELATIVRETESTNSLPILFLSGELSQWRQIQASGLSAEFILTKPVIADQLEATLQALAQRARQNAALFSKEAE
ncbi:response regulator [Marinobacter sp. V034]|uniref:response regulator n=1 Tax=Marinobacter sp. V034 TaxID=3459610 RepID=UPI0040441F04